MRDLIGYTVPYDRDRDVELMVPEVYNALEAVPWDDVSVSVAGALRATSVEATHALRAHSDILAVVPCHSEAVQSWGYDEIAEWLRSRRARRDPGSFDNADDYLDALYGVEGDTGVPVLEDAQDTVNDRENDYGEASETHRRVARLWTAYLDLPEGEISAHDAAVMLGQMKDARIRENPERRDSWVDEAGYTSCGWRCVDEARDIHTEAAARTEDDNDT